MAVSRAAGYTLLELLVVLAIIGLIAALGAPLAGQAIAGATLRSDARAISSALREAQHRAAAEQRTIAIAPQAGGSPPALFADRGIAAEARIVMVPGTIRFFPDGTTDGGTVRLEEAGRRLDLNIAWLTGDISIGDGS